MNYFSNVKALELFLGSTDPSFRPTCGRHWRYLDATGLCSHCQREAAQEAQERAEVELARQVAVAGECADRAVMWGLA